MVFLDSALGIEIRRDKLIFAAVRKGFQDFTLRSCTVIEDYRNLPLPRLRDRLSRYLKSNGFNRENVILGLPREEAVIRYIDLPLEVEENLDQVVQFQLEKFEPSEEGGSYHDYVVVQKDAGKRKIRLQLIMVPKGLLDEYLRIFHELNLYPTAVRFSSVGMYQLFSIHEEGFPGKSPYLVLNIDSDSLEMAILTDSSGFCSSKVFVSPEDLSSERIVREVDVFLTQTGLAAEGLAKIYLTGPGGELFLEEFRRRFEDCEPLAGKIKLKRKSSFSSNLDPLLGAVGLAVSGLTRSRHTRFNLIPKEKRVIGERPSLVPTILLAGLLVIMGVTLGYRGHSQTQSLISQLEAKSEKMQPQVNRSIALRQQVQQRQTELDELRELMKGRQRALMVLKELTEKLPDNAFLANLNVQGERVSITGHADSASTLLPVLLNSKYFKSVESRYIVPDKSMKKEKFNFELTIRRSSNSEP